MLKKLHNNGNKPLFLDEEKYLYKRHIFSLKFPSQTLICHLEAELRKHLFRGKKKFLSKLKKTFSIYHQLYIINMYFTVQSKTSTGILTIKQIIFTLVLLIVLVGQASSIPLPLAPHVGSFDGGDFDST